MRKRQQSSAKSHGIKTQKVRLEYPVLQESESENRNSTKQFLPFHRFGWLRLFHDRVELAPGHKERRPTPGCLDETGGQLECGDYGHLS